VNYRHAFHAGGVADVFKHAALALLIDRLRAKDKAFFMLDTHAGIGLYDLAGDEATRTGEAITGILQLAAAPAIGPHLARYLEIVRSFNPGSSDIRYYPGSPSVVHAAKRHEDRLVLCELHPEDAATLKHVVRHAANVAAHRRDGYEGLKAFLPPPERRGLVLIDPPFEDRNELKYLVDALEMAWKRWPTGQYVVWYPIKDRRLIERFFAELGNTGIRKALVAEFLPESADQADKLNGSGLLLINPPWQIEDALSDLMSELKIALNRPEARTRLEWLIGE
jgi:23S rRNA (adenine2030-N6)-methyltransferase